MTADKCNSPIDGIIDFLQARHIWLIPGSCSFNASGGIDQTFKIIFPGKAGMKSE